MGVRRRAWDAIVVGSGFGGSVAAKTLADAGLDVLVVERGARVRRGPAAWAPAGTLELTEHYPVVARHAQGTPRTEGVKSPVCVGGGSVFYGGVSLRLRESDFAPHPLIRGDSPGWPFGYEELQAAYDDVERLLDVAGCAGADPLEPPRAGPYPQASPELSPVARRIAGAAESLGMRPFRLPLAINHRVQPDRGTCALCDTCDTFACAIGAKNDMATVVLPVLEQGTVTVADGLKVERLRTRAGRVVALEAREVDGTRISLHAETYYLAAGALGTPALLLASGLDAESPAGDAVGRYLTRHCSAIVMGLFPRRLDGGETFHKQVGVHDFYDGDPQRGWDSPLGVLQQMSSPPVGLLEREAPRLLRPAIAPVRRRLTGLLAMAHDEPRRHNCVRLSEGRSGELVVEHQYSARDLAARRHLAGRAGEVLRAAGAVHRHDYLIPTFSHAVGTVRMGDDPDTCPVDRHGAFRGMENLHVVDGSVLPTPGAVNPSLTIAATALRSTRASLGVGAEQGAARAA